MKLLLALCLSLAFAAPAAHAQEDGTAAAERARIGAERSEADKLLAAREAACYRKFGVTDCLNAARAQRRERMADLRRQELTLNDAERKRRAADHVRDIEERNSAGKQQEAATQREEAAARQREKKEAMEQRAAERAQAQASAPVRAPRDPKVRQAPSPASHSAKTPQQHDTAQAMRESNERQLQAQERRDRVARRLAEPARPEVKPLPVPP